jgi:hypothetical protein
MGFYPEIALKILPPRKRFQVAVFVFDPEEDFGERAQADEGSVTACVSRWRRLDPQTVPIEAKVAANYVNGIVARMEARNLGLDYAILLDAQGCLAEGGTESLFLVREGRLLTPSLGTILNSITRKTLLDVAETMGIGTFSGRLDPGVLHETDEIFFSGTTTKLLPVRQVGERILKEVPGPVTRRLAERMAAITSGRDAQYRHWLFGIDRKMFGGWLYSWTPERRDLLPPEDGGEKPLFLLLRSQMDNRRHGIGNPLRGQVPVGTARMVVKLTLEKHDISLKIIPSLPRGEISNLFSK